MFFTHVLVLGQPEAVSAAFTTKKILISDKRSFKLQSDALRDLKRVSLTELDYSNLGLDQRTHSLQRGRKFFPGNNDITELILCKYFTVLSKDTVL